MTDKDKYEIPIRYIEEDDWEDLPAAEEVEDDE